MSSAKAKKKSKSAQIPKPIKIKKEDDHIMYPMEHYVDDRVELIRQIFSSLKPKTITNLAPDFLKKHKLEDIQEQCLNEILGISKKRLLSIINSTKCPTDTETSEEDVHSVEEHISLEEISSDSDIVEQNGPKITKGNSKKKPKIKGESKDENNKQFSVLELLELQARARAIRSQLALEPVTKIEVDTDSENGEPPVKKPETSIATSHKRQKSANGIASSSKPSLTKRPTAVSVTVTVPNGGETVPSATTKRVKLKRNFRKQTLEDDSNDEAKKQDSLLITTKNIQPKKEARSPSPDVIPIVAVPETLCISDSDDDKKAKKDTSNDTEISKSDDILKPVEILSVVNIQPVNIPEESSESSQANEKPDEALTESIPAEPEEGEILEEEVKAKPLISDKSESTTLITETNEITLEITTDEKATSNNIIQLPCEVVEKTISITSKEVSDNKPQSLDTSDSDDDSNDDVISLEGGDLLNEMKEHLKDEICESKDTKEVICLDDSSDEEIDDKKESESWNERWLKSSKVSKVLATSRLGNRVRNKIKECKKAKKLKEAAIIESELSKPQEVIFTSRHEDGSVEQYKELLEKIKAKSN